MACSCARGPEWRGKQGDHVGRAGWASGQGWRCIDTRWWSLTSPTDLTGLCVWLNPHSTVESGETPPMMSQRDQSSEMAFEFKKLV
jgi:hypothetical protein